MRDENAIQRKVAEFLDRHELAIISTIHADKNAPESAIVGFGNTEDLEIIFGTSVSTRKYANLQKNCNVSFVIGWSSETGSVQYEGVARELTREEVPAYGHLLVKKNEDHRNFLILPDQRYFIVKPTWLRLYDNAGDPPDTYEMSVIAGTLTVAAEVLPETGPSQGAAEEG